MSQNKPLTAKQELFARFYVANGFKKREAALSAGYSEDSAATTASEILSYPNVIDFIEELKLKTTKKAESKAEELIELVETGIDFDPTEWFNVTSKGELILKHDLDKLPPKVRKLIDGWKCTKFGVEVKFVSKQFLMDMKARFHSMYKDQVTVKNTYENATDAELEAKLKEMEGK